MGAEEEKTFKCLVEYLSREALEQLTLVHYRTIETLNIQLTEQQQRAERAEALIERCKSLAQGAKSAQDSCRYAAPEILHDHLNRTLDRAFELVDELLKPAEAEATDQTQTPPQSRSS